MTTIIERPGGDDSGGTAVLGVFLGIILAALIAMFALGVFEPRDASKTAEIKIETPAVPTPEPAKPN
jgi:hypothetical protein